VFDRKKDRNKERHIDRLIDRERAIKKEGQKDRKEGVALKRSS